MTNLAVVDADHLQAQLTRIETSMQALERRLQAPAPSHSGSESENMTRDEVAGYFRISKTTVHTWMKKGLLTPHHVGHRTLFKRSEVEGLMTSKTGVSRG